MAHYINKAALIAEIERKQKEEVFYDEDGSFASLADQNHHSTLESIKNFIDTLEVKDSHEQCIQYDSIKTGIQAHAETYSFNIESELFNQLKKEQQALWKKEIEQAYISGGYNGIELAKDLCYKENLEVKEVNLEEELNKEWSNCEPIDEGMGLEIASIEHEQFDNIAKHFFELGLKAKGK